MPETGTISIIIQSGEYGRVHHALSIALTTLAFGRKVRIFFTWWALEYVKNDVNWEELMSGGNNAQRELIEKQTREGHLRPVADLLNDAHELDCEMYACVSSMALLNIARDELIPAINSSTGIATFLEKSADGRLLYV